MPTILEEFGAWYEARCNGSWEHDFGISIESLDNPGWRIRIDLAGTVVEGCILAPVSAGVESGGEPNARRWMSCRANGTRFEGAGDPSRIEDILLLFMDWCDAQKQGSQGG